jgi:hypothetical protein
MEANKKSSNVLGRVAYKLNEISCMLRARAEESNIPEDELRQQLVGVDAQLDAIKIAMRRSGDQSNLALLESETPRLSIERSPSYLGLEGSQPSGTIVDHVNSMEQNDVMLANEYFDTEASSPLVIRTETSFRAVGTTSTIPTPFNNKWLRVVLVVIFLGAIEFSVLRKNSHGKAIEENRFNEVKDCAAVLSKTHTVAEDPQSPQYKAMIWFLTSGESIKVPAKCRWDSEFGLMYALLVIRESLDVKDVSWYTAPPTNVCHWARVQCNPFGGVTGLYFNNANLSGTLPNELAGLVHLEQLELYSNTGIHGTIPSTALAGLIALKSLQLQDTSVGGTMPKDLGALTDLEELFVDRTLMTGEMPAEICQLRQHKLNSLHASCDGTHPMLQCSCCTSCKSTSTSSWSSTLQH